jgi:hypothetical protein
VSVRVPARVSRSNNTDGSDGNVVAEMAGAVCSLNWFGVSFRHHADECRAGLACRDPTLHVRVFSE